MGLQAQLPARAPLAGVDRQPRVELRQRAVHRLHEKMVEPELFVGCQVLAGLRNHDLDFVAAADDQVRTDFRADAHPVDPGRHRQGAVGFDGDLEAGQVHRVDQRAVELQQRLAAGEHDILAGWVTRRPQAVDGVRQVGRPGKLAAAFAVGADEISVAKRADGAVAVDLAAGPQIAAGKSAKDRRPPRVGAFALQGIENLFNAVSHCTPQSSTGHYSAAGGSGHAGRSAPDWCPVGILLISNKTANHAAR